MKIKQIKFLLLAVTALTLAACKTTSKVVQPSTPETKPAEASHQLTPAEMVKQIQQMQPAFRTAYARKMSLFVDFKGRQMDVKASCKIVSDSAMHLSIQPFFGVELFRLEMTPSTLIVVDKMNKMFYESNYGIFRNTLGVTVNYDVIQSLISNRLFVPGDKVFIPDDFSWKNNTPGGSIMYQTQTFGQEVMIDQVLSRIAAILIESNDKAYNMKTGYSDFKKFDGVLFPEKISIDAGNGENKSSFHFTIEEAEFNKPLVMEPADLSRYTRGNISSLFRK